jgi:hypothetical protein
VRQPAGPKLHTFIWDYHHITGDSLSERWQEFGQPEKGWNIKFGQLAAAQKSALRHIKIIFTPLRWSAPLTRQELTDWAYPWDLMDEAAEKLRPLGIDLSYNKKPKEEADEIVRKIKWEILDEQYQEGRDAVSDDIPDDHIHSLTEIEREESGCLGSLISL